MANPIVYLFVAIIVILGAYLFSIKSSGRVDAIKLCVELCRNYDGNKTSGPCLSNETVSGWACDIAHYPRYWSDNLEENQCPSYGNNASHFVEVDENCSLIRAL